MMEREAMIVNPLGMHARPAAEFVKIAARFRSQVDVTKGDLTVNGKSIMGVMMLAAECGSSLLIRTDGDDRGGGRREAPTLRSPRGRRLPRDGRDRNRVGGRGVPVVTERLLRGIGVSPGIAIGPALIVRWTMPEVPSRVVPKTQVGKEVRRLKAAVSDVKRHLLELEG